MVPLASANGYATWDTVAAASFAIANLNKAVAGVKTRNRGVLLDSAYIAALTNVPIQRNFPVGIHEVSDWSTAGAAVVGFAGDKSAVVVASGRVPVPRDADHSVFTLQPLGLSVSASVWWSTATRGNWMSFDCMIGAAVGKTGSGILLKSS